MKRLYFLVALSVAALLLSVWNRICRSRLPKPCP